MKKSLCGTDCEKCEMNESCGGCLETGGKPFGSDCVVARCCQKTEANGCSNCANVCDLKSKIIAEFNDLNIEGMPKVESLNALLGSFINVEYTMQNGQKVKFFDDNKVYLGNQLQKENSVRCFGLTADENCLLVCEYGENGADVELVAYKKR